MLRRGTLECYDVALLILTVGWNAVMTGEWNEYMRDEMQCFEKIWNWNRWLWYGGKVGSPMKETQKSIEEWGRRLIPQPALSPAPDPLSYLSSFKGSLDSPLILYILAYCDRRQSNKGRVKRKGKSNMPEELQACGATPSLSGLWQGVATCWASPSLSVLGLVVGSEGMRRPTSSVSKRQVPN